MVTIYALSDPRTTEVRYVGLTKNSIQNRYKQHLRRRSGNIHKQNWIMLLSKTDQLPTLRILSEVTVEDAVNTEHSGKPMKLLK